MKQLKYPAIGFFISFFIFFSITTNAGEVEQLVPGNHVLTLQWLQNHQGVGKAKIFKKDGKILLEGYQEENYEGNLNYMTIKGTIKVISPRELEFEGKIVTRINYINDGLQHERNGKFLLKAWGKRQYWRMQKMTQPDKEHTVTDYIDIYFAKYR